MITEVVIRPADGQEQKVSLYLFGKELTGEILCTLLGSFVNSYSFRFYKVADAFVDAMIGEHRTVQGLIVNLLLAILARYGKTEYSDGRNDVAVATCKKIKKLVDSGELEYQPFI